MNDIENKITNYYKDKKDIIAVYLFGSYASHKEKDFSDIDIAILLAHPALQHATAVQTECITQLGRILKKDVHPVILNTASETIIKQIFQKGKCLAVNDNKEHAKFKMTAFSKILDFSYYHKQMQSGFLKSLLEVEK